MDITPVVSKGKQVITGYGNGQFKVSGQVYTTPILVFPDRTVQWTIKGHNINAESLSVVIEEEGEIDLLIIGSGKQQMVTPNPLRAALKEVGISLEIMDTGAAVRTYNVVLAEGRRVAAALLPV